MKTSDIKVKAREFGVEETGKKADLIRRIQKAEGYEECFGTKQSCPQLDCCWRDDCLTGSRRVRPQVV